MMEEKFEYETPSTGKSFSFAIGFIAAYVIILFIILAVFFTIPF
jgi:hypothetical protein